MKKIGLYILVTVNIYSGQFVAESKNGWKERSQNAHVENKSRISKGSLLHFCKWVHSQFGEDGIIEEIFARIGMEKGYAVEFGAWDGVYLSNTYNLFKKGWEGHLIDGNIRRISKAKQNFPTDCKVSFSADFVIDDKSTQAGRTFDQIADQYVGDREIDFLSIDIDGLDYYILESLKRRPKVICIECNRRWHPLFEKQVAREVARNKHQPLAVYMSLAKSMGYTAVAFNVNNLFLVRDEFAYLFETCPKDCLTLWTDSFRISPCKNAFFAHRPKFKKYEDKDYDALLPITIDF